MAAYDRFYRGDIAEEIARSTQEQGGQITTEDLAEWEVKLEKLETTLQGHMRDNGGDMWLILTRENDPDPVVQLFGDWMSTSSGHRNAYIFHDPGEGRPRFSIGVKLGRCMVDDVEKARPVAALRRGCAPAGVDRRARPWWTA